MFRGWSRNITWGVAAYTLLYSEISNSGPSEGQNIKDLSTRDTAWRLKKCHPYSFNTLTISESRTTSSSIKEWIYIISQRVPFLDIPLVYWTMGVAGKHWQLDLFSVQMSKWRQCCQVGSQKNSEIMEKGVHLLLSPMHHSSFKNP